MTSVELLADLVATLANGIPKEVTGLSVPALTWRPDAEGNSIGVTVWHCSRGLDVLKVRFLEQRQALAEQWHIQGWSSKTAYDPRGIGTGGLGILAGYTQEEVAAIPVLSAEELLAYLEALVSANRADRLYAQQLARVLYSLYVGSQHIIPPIQGEDLSALY